MNHKIQYFFLKPLIALIQLFPPQFSYGLARGIADLVFLFASGRRSIGFSNLDRAFHDRLNDKEKKRILRLCMHNTAMAITDLMANRNMRKSAREKFRIHGLEHYEKAMAAEKGTVLVTSHLGSWEYLAYLFYLTDTKCSVIVKEIRNPLLDRDVNEARRETGLTPVHKKNSIRTVMTELKKNNTVAILIDQWAGNEGLWLDFFGEPTSTTSVPARLALKTGCALLPAYCLRVADGTFDIIVEEPVFVQDLPEPSEVSITQLLNRGLEKKVLQYPEQWSWMHRRWKKRPASLRAAKP